MDILQINNFWRQQSANTRHRRTATDRGRTNVGRVQFRRIVENGTKGHSVEKFTNENWTKCY